MTQALLTSILPQEIVSHIVEPYCDFTDLLRRFLDENELNAELRTHMFTHRYPDIYDLQMDHSIIQELALIEAGADPVHLIIVLMMGYFDTCPREDLFGYPHENIFTDLMMWVYVKRYHIDLAEFLPTHLSDLVTTGKFSTLTFVVNQVGIIFNVHLFLEHLVLANIITETNNVDETGDRRAWELTRLVIDHGIKDGYRPLDHHFCVHTNIRISVFGYLITHMPTLAEYYIDSFGVDEALDYMLLVNGETYLHVAARHGDTCIYRKIRDRKPILERIKNRDGEYAIISDEN